MMNAMTSTLLVKNYSEPSVSKKEILRYMGCKEPDPQVLALMEACLEEARPKMTYKVCYRRFDVSVSGDDIDLTFTKIHSPSLAKNLSGCNSAVLFAATVGIETDRLIAKYSRISPAKALCFQAIGAERIESLCDAFNDEITEEAAAQGLFTRPRFSPGYGDLSLEVQKDFFRVLDCPRKIGLSLNESLLMSPSKSVTALIGLSDAEKPCKKTSYSSCASCSKTDCNFRMDKNFRRNQ